MSTPTPDLIELVEIVAADLHGEATRAVVDQALADPSTPHDARALAELTRDVLAERVRSFDHLGERFARTFAYRAALDAEAYCAERLAIDPDDESMQKCMQIALALEAAHQRRRSDRLP